MTETPFVPTARGIAWFVLERVDRDRAFAEIVLHGALAESQLDRRDKALATELSYGCLRLRGRVDAALGQCLDRPLRRIESEVRNLLRLGAYQLICMDGIPDAAVVHETVLLARKLGFERATGFTTRCCARSPGCATSAGSPGPTPPRIRSGTSSRSARCRAGSPSGW